MHIRKGHILRSERRWCGYPYVCINSTGKCQSLHIYNSCAHHHHSRHYQDDNIMWEIRSRISCTLAALLVDIFSAHIHRTTHKRMRFSTSKYIRGICIYRAYHILNADCILCHTQIRVWLKQHLPYTPHFPYTTKSHMVYFYIFVYNINARQFQTQDEKGSFWVKRMVLCE